MEPAMSFTVASGRRMLSLSRNSRRSTTVFSRWLSSRRSSILLFWTRTRVFTSFRLSTRAWYRMPMKNPNTSAAIAKRVCTKNFIATSWNPEVVSDPLRRSRRAVKVKRARNPFVDPLTHRHCLPSRLRNSNPQSISHLQTLRRRRAGAHLEHGRRLAHRSVVGTRILLARRRIRLDVDDGVLAIHPDDVERHERVLHPEWMEIRLREKEDHSLPVAHLGAEHVTPLLSLGRIGDLGDDEMIVREAHLGAPGVALLRGLGRRTRLRVPLRPREARSGRDAQDDHGDRRHTRQALQELLDHVTSTHPSGGKQILRRGQNRTRPPRAPSSDRR